MFCSYFRIKWRTPHAPKQVMTFREIATILALVLVSSALVDCGGKAQGNASNAASAVNANTDGDAAARTKVEDLSLLVNMPYQAQDVTWKQSRDQKKITAVLRFDPEDTGKLTADCEKIAPAQDASVDTQSWFPDELTAQSDLHGDTPLKGRAYPANPFFQDPYNSGRLVRVEGTDFFVLELAAK